MCKNPSGCPDRAHLSAIWPCTRYRPTSMSDLKRYVSLGLWTLRALPFLFAELWSFLMIGGFLDSDRGPMDFAVMAAAIGCVVLPALAIWCLDRVGRQTIG